MTEQGGGWARQDENSPHPTGPFASEKARAEPLTQPWVDELLEENRRLRLAVERMQTG